MRILLSLVLPAAATLLAACAAGGPSAPGDRAMTVEAAGYTGVVIGPVASNTDEAAARLAGEHCQQHGLHARFARMVAPASVHFQCLP